MSKTLATFSRDALTALEDGNTKTKSVTVTLNDKGIFAVELPAHVVEVLNYNRTITGETLMKAIQEYESVCDSFSRWRLGKMPKPMLLFVNAQGPDSYDGVTHSIGIGLHEVLVDFLDESNHGLPRIYKRTDHPMRLGTTIFEAHGSWNCVLFEDTPEIRAKFALLADSIRQAASVLEPFCDYERLGMDQQFLSISFTQAPPQKEATPEPATPAQPELPFNTPNPDDEEL